MLCSDCYFTEHSLRAATLRDLKREFQDSQIEEIISSCTDDDPSKRPSSFTLLEMAAKGLAQITSQPFPERFLPNSYGEKRYLFQAILETIDRFFTTYQAVKSHRIKETTSRLRLLIDDWPGGKANILQALDLDKSPHLALILEDLDRAKALIRLSHKESKGSWGTCGFTPLHIACREAYADVVECWLEHGYEVDAQDDKGRSALHWTVFAGSPTLCDMLLEAKAKTDLADSEGATALHRAAESEDITILVKILDKGAEINAKDKEGATPLHRAAAAGRERAVRTLLQKDADPFAVDKDGFTPQQSANVNGFRAVGDLLRMMPQVAREPSHDDKVERR